MGPVSVEVENDDDITFLKNGCCFTVCRHRSQSVVILS